MVKLSETLHINSPTLREVSFYVRKFLIERFTYVSQRQAFYINEMEVEPKVWKDFLIQKYEYTNYDKLVMLVKNYILKSGFYFFCGAKGSGKTTLIYFLYYLIRLFDKEVKIYIRNAEPIGDMILLENYDSLNPYSNLPNNSILFHDEVHLDIDNMMLPTSKEYKALRDCFTTLRHTGRTIFHISQNTFNFIKNLLRLCDGHIYLRTSMMKELEREEFLPYITKSQSVLEKGFNFVFINEFELFQIQYSRPDSLSSSASFYFASVNNKIKGVDVK